jgi:cyclic pyranopterin phosphate synthase
MNKPGVIAYHGKGNIYLNVTNRCSCACTFCLREFTDEVYGYPLVLDHEPSVEQITQALELAFLDEPADEVVFCGLGEPTLRLPEVLAVTEWLRLRRIPTRLNTNGLGRLANPDAAACPSAYTPPTPRPTTGSAGPSTPRLFARCSPLRGSASPPVCRRP